MSAFQNKSTPWNIAAPSFVWPARVGDNCYYLQNRVDEIEIIFFETQGSLNYTQLDLPEDLKNLDLDYHLHLPMDLPWEKGALEVVQNIEELAGKVAYLSPHCFVLHPPADPDLFSDFHQAWEAHPELKQKKLLLENVREKAPRPLADLLGELRSHHVKFCLDIGHWSSYGSGSQYQNLPQWIQTLGPYLSHLHLHDNDGIADLHLGLGQGCIPWVELFGGLEFMELSPSFALEPHCQEDLEQSLSFMKKHMNWFSRLGVRRRDLPEL